MPLDFLQNATKTSLFNLLNTLRENINCNMNCVKVATVEEFYPDNLTVSCRVANKRLIGLQDDGNQQLRDYALIFAKVHFFGWGNIGATYPIKKGMEGVLLFNDRELETWFLTGKGGNLAYNRCHDLSDAIFICGVHSLPNMINIVADCLNLFYENSSFQISGDTIKANSQNFNIDSTKLNINGQSGVSGTFVSKDDKTITVTNGIITGIS